MDARRWEQLSLAQQLGNVGSEVARARHWEGRDHRGKRDEALIRALDLIDLTIADPRRRGGLKELCRLREVVCDWFAGSGAYEVTPEQLEAYCTSFALRGR